MAIFSLYDEIKKRHDHRTNYDHSNINVTLQTINDRGHLLSIIEEILKLRQPIYDKDIIKILEKRE